MSPAHAADADEEARIFGDILQRRENVMAPRPEIAESFERAAWRVDEFCAAYRISRTTLYKLIKVGKIRAIKIAGRTLIPSAEAARISQEGLR